MDISTYILKYANANDIATLLSNVAENITVDQSGNNLLVSASPKNQLHKFSVFT